MGLAQVLVDLLLGKHVLAVTLGVRVQQSGLGQIG